MQKPRAILIIVAQGAIDQTLRTEWAGITARIL